MKDKQDRIIVSEMLLKLSEDMGQIKRDVSVLTASINGMGEILNRLGAFLGVEWSQDIAKWVPKGKIEQLRAVTTNIGDKVIEIIKKQEEQEAQPGNGKDIKE